MFYKLKTSKGDRGFKVTILLDLKILFIWEQLQHSDNVFRLVTEIKSFTPGKGLNLTLTNIHQTYIKPAADEIDNVEVKKGKPKFN